MQSGHLPRLWRGFSVFRGPFVVVLWTSIRDFSNRTVLNLFTTWLVEANFRFVLELLSRRLLDRYCLYIGVDGSIQNLVLKAKNFDCSDNFFVIENLKSFFFRVMFFCAALSPLFHYSITLYLFLKVLQRLGVIFFKHNPGFPE